MTSYRLTLTTLMAALWLAGCGSVSLEHAAPHSFNLSGDWVLVPDLSDAPPKPREIRSRGGSLLTFVVQDFPVLDARRLHIEQNRDSMGISYDGGDYRDVSWGTRQRGLWEVRAGWNEGRLMILSDAPDGRGQEILTLSQDGQQLEVFVEVHAGGDSVKAVRTYRRA
ncbi:MAG: hypothetical protein R3E86_01055 [Pseudomonadales bacterium]